MKVIDLLNKIANREEVPERIKFLFNEYEYDKDNLRYKNIEKGKSDLLKCIDFYKGIVLNDEIEIPEDTPAFKGFKVKNEEIIYKEDKKIDKIKLTNGGLTIHIIVGGVESDYSLTKTERTIIYKLNEIIDHLNVEK